MYRPTTRLLCITIRKERKGERKKKERVKKNKEKERAKAKKEEREKRKKSREEIKIDRLMFYIFIALLQYILY